MDLSNIRYTDTSRIINQTCDIRGIRKFNYGKPLTHPTLSENVTDGVSSRTDIDNYKPELDENIDLNQIVDPAALKFKKKKNLQTIESIETPATILIFDAKKLNIVYKTNKFILQTINRPKMEKFQIVETFGDAHFFFFNERTKIYTFGGIMLDAFYETTSLEREELRVKYQWAQGFQNFYDNYLRGTQLTQNNQIAAIFVNDILIKGYPIQLVISKESAGLPDGVQFQMTWIVKDEILLHAGVAENLYNESSSSTILTNAWNDYFLKLDIYNNKKRIYDLNNNPTAAQYRAEKIISLDTTREQEASHLERLYGELTAAYVDVLLASSEINSLESQHLQTPDWD